MLTLVGEVIYYRNKRKKSEEVKSLQIKPSPNTNRETFNNNIKLIHPETITIGKEFKPLNYNILDSDLIKPPKMLYPRSRNRVHQSNLKNIIGE